MPAVGHHPETVDRSRRVARHGVAVLLLIGIRHVYGAVLYGTPWRSHAVVVGVAAALVMVGALALVRARYGTAVGRIVSAYQRNEA